MATRMRAEAYPGENQAALPAPETIAEMFVKLALAENELTGELVTREITIPQS
jgi:hypothetical protein